MTNFERKKKIIRGGERKYQDFKFYKGSKKRSAKREKKNGGGNRLTP